MEENIQKKNEIKAFIFGDSKVGKSTILYKYLNEVETKVPTTVGVDLQIKKLEDNSLFKIRDCSGEERFRKAAKMQCQCSDGAFIVYDITDKKTFESIAGFAESFRNINSQTSPIIILGNKTDLKDKRTVSYEEGIKKAKDLNASFYEVNKDDKETISEAFGKMIELVKKKWEDDKKIKKEDGGSCCGCFK